MRVVNALRDSFAWFQRDFGLALRRYTRLPSAAGLPDDAATAAAPPHALLPHLPGVGWLVGLAACLAFALVALPVRANPWGALVAAMACTVATALLTGAMHESALFRTAETAQGRAGAAVAGSGTLALLLVVGGKLVLLAALAAASEAAVMAGLFAAHVVSRFVPVAVAHWTTPAEVDGRAVRTAGLWTIVPLALLLAAGGPALLLVPLVVAALAVLALLRWLRRRGAAFDEKATGTLQQVGEAAFYLGMVIGGG